VNDTVDPIETTTTTTGSTGPTADPAAPSEVRYLAPQRATNVFNRIVARLTRMGVSVWGSRELRVRGRRSGEWRTTPVNLLRHEGRTYLVAPRGTTQWVRNLRAADGHGELRLGRNIDAFTAAELADTDKAPVLRAYLKRWKMEVGVFFDGVDASATDDELLAIAPGYPVFEVAIAS
jgi:deazaflavin-dependent oxidoreductase (nitroreductase family)